jgi:predicted transcriptional regulator
MGTSYRSSTAIVGNVLHIALENKEINHTAVLRKANLSHANLCRLMSKLLQAGMVNERFHEGQRIYSITSKGIEYLEKYRQFAQLTEAFGLRL